LLFKREEGMPMESFFSAEVPVDYDDPNAIFKAIEEAGYSRKSFNLTPLTLVW